jgi:AraC-like DNA-binding protein
MSVAAHVPAPAPRTVSGGVRGGLPSATLSVRVLWPFARVMGTNHETAEMLAGAGVGAAEFTQSDTRVPHRVVKELLEVALETTGDPALGLHAAEVTDAADLDVLAYAARSCNNLREALECTCRYFRLMNDAADLVLEERPDRVWLTYRVRDGIEEPAACADFVMATFLTFARRHVAADVRVGEVWLTQDLPADVQEHVRVLGCGVRFGAPSNSIVLPRQYLATPMRHPDPRLTRAYRRRAERMLERLRENDGVAGRVREMVVSHLGSGAVSMEWAARRVAMSVPTLRRRLAEEGTTFREIMDDSRRQLAQRHLSEDPSGSVTEVAFLLGFSDVASFCRAFKRWTGLGPSEYRARIRG